MNKSLVGTISLFQMKDPVPITANIGSRYLHIGTQEIDSQEADVDCIIRKVGSHFQLDFFPDTKQLWSSGTTLELRYKERWRYHLEAKDIQSIRDLAEVRGHDIPTDASEQDIVRLGGRMLDSIEILPTPLTDAEALSQNNAILQAVKTPLCAIEILTNTHLDQLCKSGQLLKSSIPGVDDTLIERVEIQEIPGAKKSDGSSLYRQRIISGSIDRLSEVLQKRALAGGNRLVIDDGVTDDTYTRLQKNDFSETASSSDLFTLDGCDTPSQIVYNGTNFSLLKCLMISGAVPYNPLTDVPDWTFYIDTQNNNYTTVSGNVDTVTSEAAGALVATQSGGRPAVNNAGINGKRTFTFSGQSLQRATGWPTNSDFTLVVVHKPTNTIPGAASAFAGSTDNSLFNGNFFGWGNGHYYNTYIGGQNTTLSTGPNSSRFINRANKPRIDIYTYRASDKKHDLYVNGCHVKTGYGDPSTIQTNASISIGQAYGWASYSGEIGHFALNSRLLTPTEITNHVNYLLTRWSFPTEKMLIFDGDSLSIGAITDGVTGDLGTTEQRLMDLLADPTAYFIVNTAIGSTMLQDFDTRAALADGMDQMATPANCNARYLVVWGGTNDVGNTGGDYTTTYNRLRTYLQNRTAAKSYNKVGVLTSIPRENTTFNTALFNYNNLIRTNWTTLQSDGATQLIDVNTISQFDADGDYNNTTYYNGDKIHLTDAGRLLIAPLIKSTMGLT